MNDHHDDIPISPEGLRRKEEMLSAIMPAVRWRRRKRRAAQASLVAAPLVLIAAVVLLQTSSQPPVIPQTPIAQNDPPTARQDVTPATTGQYKNINFERVAYSKPAVNEIKDDELLELLRSSGRQVGLARIGGELRIAGDLNPVVPSSVEDDAETEGEPAAPDAAS